MSTSTLAKQETWQEKLVRRVKEEPLVPIGVLITTFTLVMASTKVGKKGQAKSMNRWLRARVVAQGATVAAIVGGSYVYGNTNQQRDARESTAAAAAEELKLKEKREFEERLRAAEETHAMEEQAKTAAPEQRGSSFWPTLGWTGTVKEASVTSTQTAQPSISTSASSSSPPEPVPSSSTAASERTTSQSSRRSWFSWGSSKSSSGAEDTKA